MSRATVIGTFTLAAALAQPASGMAQELLASDGEEVLFRDRLLERSPRVDAPLVSSRECYVVVHLTENRVFVFEGERRSGPLRRVPARASSSRPASIAGASQRLVG